MPKMVHSSPSSFAFRRRGSFFSLSQHLSEIGNSLYLSYFFKITVNVILRILLCAFRKSMLICSYGTRYPFGKHRISISFNYFFKCPKFSVAIYGKDSNNVCAVFFLFPFNMLNGFGIFICCICKQVQNIWVHAFGNVGKNG